MGRKRKTDSVWKTYVLNATALSVPQSIKALYVYTALKKSQKEILNEFIALAFFDFFKSR